MGCLSVNSSPPTRLPAWNQEMILKAGMEVGLKPQVTCALHTRGPLAPAPFLQPAPIHNGPKHPIFPHLELPSSPASPPATLIFHPRPRRRRLPAPNLTAGGRILQMPDFSAMGLIFAMYPRGSRNSAQLGSNTGHSGGGRKSSDPGSMVGPRNGPGISRARTALKGSWRHRYLKPRHCSETRP